MPSMFALPERKWGTCLHSSEIHAQMFALFPSQLHTQGVRDHRETRTGRVCSWDANNGNRVDRVEVHQYPTANDHHLNTPHPSPLALRTAREGLTTPAGVY